MMDFFRISFKKDYTPGAQSGNEGPHAAIYFYSPKHPLDWDLEDQLHGNYIQLSKQLVSKHRYLFLNYMEYGQHEPLLLTDHEKQEIEEIFHSLMRRYNKDPENTSVLISYTHVLVTLIESFYQRQFSTDITKYNTIVSEFQQLLRDYYKQDADQLPTVQDFSDKLHLTPNYLVDIIKRHTDKTAIQTIHKFVVHRAQELLRKQHATVSQIAYELGSEYPNNFSKFFKHHTEVTPSEFRRTLATSTDTE